MDFDVKVSGGAAVFGDIFDARDSDAAGELVGLPPGLDLCGEHSADGVVEFDALDGGGEGGGIHVDDTADARSCGVSFCAAVEFEAVAVGSVDQGSGYELAVDGHRADAFVAAVDDAAVFDDTAAEDDFWEGDGAVWGVGLFGLFLGTEEGVIPAGGRVGIEVFAESEARIEGEDLGGVHSAGEESWDTGTDEEGASGEEQGVGAVVVTDEEFDAFEAEAVEKGEVGAAELDLAADDFGEVVFGHRADSFWIGHSPIGDDDSDEEEEQAGGEDLASPGTWRAWGAQGWVDGGVEKWVGMGHGLSVVDDVIVE